MNALHADQTSIDSEGYHIPYEKREITPLGIPGRKDGKPRPTGGRKGNKRYTSDYGRDHLKRVLEEEPKQLDLRLFNLADYDMAMIIKDLEKSVKRVKKEGRTTRTGRTGRETRREEPKKRRK